MKARAKRGKKSKAFESRPELFEDLSEIWKAFVVLDSARFPTNYYEGPKPLAIHDIVAWLDLHRLEGEERLEYFELIRVLDDAWLKKSRERFKIEMERSNRRKR